MGYLRDLKESLTNGLLSKGKNSNFTTGGHLNEVNKVDITNAGLMDIMCPLRRTHHFCGVPAKNV